MGKSSQARTRVKICGTTRVEDALLAANCGVDALGFILYKKSPRYIEPECATKIIEELPPFVQSVGVVVNASIDELVGTNNNFSYLQLHGSESVKYCRELRRKLPQCGIIKAFRVGSESRAEDFSEYNAHVDAFLLDTYIKDTMGGTGESFDWSIIETFQLKRPFLLAGGINPENVLDAIDRVRPFGVDINSGIEVSPGIKDHARLSKIMQLISIRKS